MRDTFRQERLEGAFEDVALHQVKEKHLSAASHRVLATDRPVGAQGLVADLVHEQTVLAAAVAVEFARERNDGRDLLHHQIGNVAEALFAVGARFDTFRLAGAAHDVPFAALRHRCRDPVVANGTIEQVYQGVVVY